MDGERADFGGGGGGFGGCKNISARKKAKRKTFAVQTTSNANAICTLSADQI